ncbi:MAG: glycosyltransferase family 25 protein, partial [Pseudomonadota bacterium]
MGWIVYPTINLRQSEDRWALIAADAARCGIELRRIDAVDGRQIDRSDWRDFDAAKFARCNGRRPMAGEYGCYRSHVKALQTFLETDATSAVILEDDARLNELLPTFAAMLDERYGRKKCLVRLTSHRQPAFEKLKNGLDGYVIGQCWFGPTGSAAAYWLTRPAAEQLLQTMLPA